MLYVPLGFLGVLALLQHRCWRSAAFVLAIAAAWMLAISVEYTQLFFSPRTVSINDLLAEAIGSVLGAAAAVAAASRSAQWEPLQRVGLTWLQGQALALYAGVYLAYGLFPYDLLVSGAELADKLASESWGWWLARGDGRPLLTTARLAIELLLAAPLGALLAARRPGIGWQAALAVGLGVGLALELAQLLIATGITQGASVVARAAGLTLGVWLWRRRDAWDTARARTLVARAAPDTLPAYLLLLFAPSSQDNT